MKYSYTSFTEKTKRGFFEQKIFDFSDEIFRTPILGIILLLTLNLLYLYIYFKSRSLISVLFFLFLAYLIFSILIVNLLGLKRNK